MKSMYGRKTITYNYNPPKKVFMQAGEQVFRGFIGGDAFITKQGYRGLSIDSIWSQQIFIAFETDDEDLVEVALKSVLADVNAKVTGGEFGSAYSIGDYGFYSKNQFEEQAEYLSEIERQNAPKDQFLSNDEWRKIDDYLSSVAHHSKASFTLVYRGDTFAALAVRKNAYRVARLFLRHGLDLLSVNENDEDLVDVAKAQYSILSEQYKIIQTKQIVFYHQTKTKNEMDNLRREQEDIVKGFAGMIEFVKDCSKYLEDALLVIEGDMALKRQCELLHKPFPAEKEFIVSRRGRALQHREDLKELLQYTEQKLLSCKQSFEDFEEKLKVFLQRKFDLAKAIRRGATKDSLIVIAKRHGGSTDNEDLKNLRIQEGLADAVYTVKKNENENENNEVVAPETSLAVVPSIEPDVLKEESRPSTAISFSFDENEKSEKKSRRLRGPVKKTEDTVIYYNVMESAPTVLAQYRLGKTLGIGAFGKVKLAQHLITGVNVAIKILNKGKILHMEKEEKVRREINVLRLCTHPHIIRLYEVIDTPSDTFLILEYAAGGELFDYIASRGRLSPDEARHFFQQIISGVDYCHRNRIVHRDLKRENLLLDVNNKVKIADFGFSNVTYDGDFLRTPCGSPSYAAPEIISGNLYAGPEVDVWSCGVILYALLCGRLPFEALTIPKLFCKIKSGMYSLPHSLCQSSRDLIIRMLMVDPLKRITLKEVTQHPWFQHRLPDYLTLHPTLIEMQERSRDPEIIEKVSQLSAFHGVTPDIVTQIVFSTGKEEDKQLKVAYELLLHEKRQKRRIEDVLRVFDDSSTTNPASSSGFSGLSLTSNTFHNEYNNKTGTPILGEPAQRPPASKDSRDLSSRRSRWYLGIQSKKDSAHVMNEVYKALKALKCLWYQVTNYRIVCRWEYTPYIVSKPKPSLMSSALALIQADLDSKTSNKVKDPSIPRRYLNNEEPSKMEIEYLEEDLDNMLQPMMLDDDTDDEITINEVESYHDKEQGSSNFHKDQGCVRMNARGIASNKAIGSCSLGSHIRIALTLYKIEQNRYLLDFQRVEGDAFGFMKLCAFIVNELKNMAAASRATNKQQQIVPPQVQRSN